MLSRLHVAFWGRAGTRKYGTPVINRQNMQPRHMVSHVAPEPETAAYREHCTAASPGRCEHTQGKEAEACWCAGPADYSQTGTTTAPEKEHWIAATWAHSAQRVFNKTKPLLWLTAWLFENNGFLSGVLFEQQFVLKVFLRSILATEEQELFFDNFDQLLFTL